MVKYRSSLTPITKCRNNLLSPTYDMHQRSNAVTFLAPGVKCRNFVLTSPDVCTGGQISSQLVIVAQACPGGQISLHHVIVDSVQCASAVKNGSGLAQMVKYSNSLLSSPKCDKHQRSNSVTFLTPGV